MAVNFPGPYQLRLFYTCGPGALPALDHVLSLNLNITGTPTPGTDFSAINVARRIGADVTLDTVTSELQAVLRPLLSLADGHITHAELWVYAAGTFIADFVATYIINLDGLSGSAGRAAGLEVYAWRTQEGGLMKIYVIEGVETTNAQKIYTALTASQQDFVDWFHEDATSYALARDTSYPLVFTKMSPSQHEAVFKKRYRP